MKLQYQQLNPHSNSLGRALERWSIRSPFIQHLMNTYNESSRKAGLNLTETIRLDDARHPNHQIWVHQDPKNEEWVANKTKDKQSFFLKLLLKPIVNNFIVPIAVSLARVGKSFSTNNDEKSETESKHTGANKSNQPGSNQAQATSKARIIDEMNRMETTKKTNRIKKTTEITRVNKKADLINAAAALSPVSSIKAPGTINPPSPKPQKSKEEENARIASRKPLSTKPKDPTDPY